MVYGLILIYLLLLVIIYVAQGWMIFPGRMTQGQRGAIISPLAAASDNDELLHLTTSTGESVVALFGRATDENGLPLADYCASADGFAVLWQWDVADGCSWVG